MFYAGSASIKNWNRRRVVIGAAIDPNLPHRRTPRSLKPTAFLAGRDDIKRNTALFIALYGYYVFICETLRYRGLGGYITKWKTIEENNYMYLPVKKPDPAIDIISEVRCYFCSLC